MMGQKEDNKKKLTKTRKCKRSKEKESGTGKGNVKILNDEEEATG